MDKFGTREPVMGYEAVEEELTNLIDSVRRRKEVILADPDLRFGLNPQDSHGFDLNSSAQKLKGAIERGIKKRINFIILTNPNMIMNNYGKNALFELIGKEGVRFFRIDDYKNAFPFPFLLTP